MTAVTDTRKRSRDEDTCDFMPISKRINNLTLTSQSLGEQETASAQNGLNGNVAINHFMAINNPGVQSQHYAHQSVMHNYANNVPPHQHQHQHQLQQYYNHGHIQSGQMPPQQQQQQQQHQNFHQSHIVQSANHSNGFQNGSHLALGTKPNQPHHLPHHQHQHMHQSHSHHHHHSIETNSNSNLINNNNDETYSPELTADENPFYYDKNKLLFDLHVARQRRHQSSH